MYYVCSMCTEVVKTLIVSAMLLGCQLEHQVDQAQPWAKHAMCGPS